MIGRGIWESLMPDTQNEKLALKMGWKREEFCDESGWRSPVELTSLHGEFYTVYELPDFCGDDCAAVKYLLSEVLKKYPRLIIGWTDNGYLYATLYASARPIYAKTFALILAAAVEALAKEIDRLQTLPDDLEKRLGEIEEHRKAVEYSIGPTDSSNHVLELTTIIRALQAKLATERELNSDIKQARIDAGFITDISFGGE